MTTENLFPSAGAERRILRLAEVERMVGFKRTHIYNLIKLGSFPSPIRLGIRAVGWDSMQIAQWVNERLQRNV